MPSWSDLITSFHAALEMGSVSDLLAAGADPLMKGLKGHNQMNAIEYARMLGNHGISDQIAMVQAARDAKSLIASLRSAIGAKPLA